MVGELPALPDLRGGRMHLASSADPTGGNDDRGHYRRVEGGRAVLMEASGPGMITRIWTANPHGTLAIWLDGGKAPAVRLPFTDLARPAKEQLALARAVSTAGGGLTWRRKIGFAKSCRVEVEGAQQLYYQINYWTFPAGTQVYPFRPEIDDRVMWKSPTPTQTTRTVTVAPGASATLFDLAGPRRITRLCLTVTPRSRAALARLRLRLRWNDAAPSVDAPLLDFFACGWGPGQVVSEAMAVADWDFFTCDLPLTFARRAVGEIVNGSGVPVTVKPTAYHWSAVGNRDGYLHAVYRAAKTKAGKPHTVATVSGRGHYVGTAVALAGESDLRFLEGDERFVVDGAETLAGTGTEDYFDSAWFFRHGAFCDPCAGAPLLLAGKSRLAAYRWHIADCVPFGKSLSVTLEHGPQNDTPGCDYRTVGYWYAAEPRPVESSPTAEPPGGYTEKPDGGPVLEAEALTPTATNVTTAVVDDAQLPLAASGGKVLRATFAADQEGTLKLPLKVKTAGLYDVALRLADGEHTDALAASLDDQPLAATDQPGLLRQPLLPLGRRRLTAGEHTLTLMAKARSGASAALDFVWLREVGKIKDALEAEDLKCSARGGKLTIDDQMPAGAQRTAQVIGGGLPTEAAWSGGAQVRLTAGKAGDSLVVPFTVKQDADCGLVASLTRGRGYVGCQVALDGRTLLDAPTPPDDPAPALVDGRLGLGTHHLRAGSHQLVFSASTPGEVGLDFLLLKTAGKGHEAECLVPLGAGALGAEVKERFGAEPRWSGGAYVRVAGGKPATFGLTVGHGGRYRLKAVAARLATGGRFGVSVADQPLGELDAKGSGEALGPSVEGVVRLRAGVNPVVLTPAGGGDMALDVIELSLERRDPPWLPIGAGVAAALVVGSLALRRRRRAAP